MGPKKIGSKNVGPKEIVTQNVGPTKFVSCKKNHRSTNVCPRIMITPCPLIMDHSLSCIYGSACILWLWSHCLLHLWITLYLVTMNYSVNCGHGSPCILWLWITLYYLTIDYPVYKLVFLQRSWGCSLPLCLKELIHLVGWVGGPARKYSHFVAPSCKLRLARFSAECGKTMNFNNFTLTDFI